MSESKIELETLEELKNELPLLRSSNVYKEQPYFLKNWTELNRCINVEVITIRYARELVIYEITNKQRKKFIQRLYNKYSTLRKKAERNYLAKMTSHEKI